MRQSKEVVTAISTLALAAGIGFVMQQTDTAKQVYGAKRIQTEQPATTLAPGQSSDASALGVRSIQLTSAAGELVLDQNAPVRVQPIATCDVQGTATALANAIIAVAMDAPCRPNAALTVHHNGMKISAVTDANGQLSMTLPALARDAVVVMAFPEGQGTILQTKVEDIADFNRMVLQWRGGAEMALHANEFGSERGGPGHVWHGADRNFRNVNTGLGGHVSRIGDASLATGLMADVYTYPIARSMLSGTIGLSIEVPVTAQTCGRELEAQSLEMSQGTLRTRDRKITMPDCDEVGTTLVLNNFVPDLKVAAR